MFCVGADSFAFKDLDTKHFLESHVLLSLLEFTCSIISQFSVFFLAEFQLQLYVDSLRLNLKFSFILSFSSALWRISSTLSFHPYIKFISGINLQNFLLSSQHFFSLT